jgi:regulator of protease activity HflC (stomatin/prohibitin superfamily)
MEMKNEYLEQVMLQKAQIEDDLRAKRGGPPAQAAMPARRRLAGLSGHVDADDTQELRLQAMAAAGGGASSGAVDYRITGWWRWKNVIVPPNAYVVHTRRGVEKPLHIGLGISFRFDPLTDSFLVVPAAMQTIIINANCICRERQGVVVQGYVQWIIDDFATAYRKLDFTDTTDPMRVVNVQLREQAEAAIKDKVATMGIDEVLADKQPIIEELTARLRAVAEGVGPDKGLGLRIVTVQIKEAVVCSPRVWEMLQRPFRAERARDARLAELSNEGIVRAREAEAEKEFARLRIDAETETARVRAEAEAKVFDREQSERVRRIEVEAKTLARTMEQEKEKLAKLRELARLKLEQELEEQSLRAGAEHARAAQEIVLEGKRREVENSLSAAAVQAKLIEALPSIAQTLPKPAELRSIQVGGADGLGAAVAGLLALADLVRSRSNDGSPAG